MGNLQTLALWHWRRLREVWEKTRGKQGAKESNGYSGLKVSQSEGNKGRKWRWGPIRKLLKEPW